MKRILPVLIVGLTFAGSMPAMELSKNVLQSISDINKKTNFLIPKLIGSYALAYSLIYAHELAHAVAFKLLLGGTSKICIPPLLINAYTENKIVVPSTTLRDEHGRIIGNKINVTTALFKGSLPPESVNKRNAIATLAGPLVGLAANVLAIKFEDILIECSHNSSNTLLKACLKGLQKPLFNSDQSSWIQLPILCVMMGNLMSLFCFADDSSDISKALGYLNINPTGSYPKISKFISNSLLFLIPYGIISSYRLIPKSK